MIVSRVKKNTKEIRSADTNFSTFPDPEYKYLIIQIPMHTFQRPES